MSANPQIIDSAECKLPKYHKKRPNERQLAARRRERTAPSNTTGLVISNLSKTKAHQQLRAMESYKQPSQLFREAIESKALSLAWQIYCDVENRAKGKPFVAINPDEAKHNTKTTDPRILVAIQNLIPGQQPTKSKRSKVIEATTVEAKALPAASQQ